MKEFKKVFRTISTNVVKEKFDEKLVADIANFKKISEEAKNFIPDSFRDLSEDHRQHLIVLYQEEIQKFIDEIEVLNTAVIAKNFEASKLSLNRLSALKESSHDSFEKP